MTTLDEKFEQLDDQFQKEEIIREGSEEDQAGPKSKSKCSMTAIFTIWNVMVGASVLTMPYSFYNSGLITGIIITFASFII